jgi:DNA-binding protein HU-beta
MASGKRPRQRRLGQARLVDPMKERAQAAGEGAEAGAKGVRTKTQVMAHLAGSAGLQRKGVAALWELLVSLAIEETKGSGQFMLPGLGKVVLDRRKARMGRNPQTGAAISIPAKTVLRFRFAKAFKEAVMSPEPAALRVVSRNKQTQGRAKRTGG